MQFKVIRRVLVVQLERIAVLEVVRPRVEGLLKKLLPLLLPTLNARPRQLRDHHVLLVVRRHNVEASHRSRRGRHHADPLRVARTDVVILVVPGLACRLPAGEGGACLHDLAHGEVVAVLREGDLCGLS